MKVTCSRSLNQAKLAEMLNSVSAHSNVKMLNFGLFRERRKKKVLLLLLNLLSMIRLVFIHF